MDKELKHMLGELYKTSYEQQFKDHPNCTEIVEKLVAGDNSFEQIDLWFAEASHYTWKKIMERTNTVPEPNEDGTVTFQIYRGLDG